MSQIDRFTTPARRTSVSGGALPSPVSRLDAAALIAQIAEQTGIRFELLGHASDTLRLYRAHMSLRMVDWAIRHFEEADITRWLKVSEDGLR